jgi:hypothetical protein
MSHFDRRVLSLCVSMSGERKMKKKMMRKRDGKIALAERERECALVWVLCLAIRKFFHFPSFLPYPQPFIQGTEQVNNAPLVNFCSC